MDNIVLLVVGVTITILGLVNLSGNISTIHSYNRRRVKEEDVCAYGRVMGCGSLIIGLTLILNGFFPENFITLPGMGIGFALMVYGQIRYNKGIF